MRIERPMLGLAVALLAAGLATPGRGLAASTTTTTSSSTTTTVGCATGATYDAILCQEGQLIAAVSGRAANFKRSKFEGLIMKSLQRLQQHTLSAQGKTGRTAKNALKSAIRDIITLNARLSSLTGKHSVDRDTAQMIITQANAIRASLTQLRAAQH